MITATYIGDNPQIPGAYDYVYVPDRLIAGNLKIVTGQGVFTGGAPISRGTVLGQVLLGAASSAVKASGANTGNGALTLDGTTPILANAKAGLYTVRFTSATAYTVNDPAGTVLGNGVVGTAFADRVKFNIAAGATAFAAGDGFDVAIAAGSMSYRACVASAVDGSSAPVAVAVDNLDATNGDIAGGVYLMAELNANALILDPSLTVAGVAAALRPLGLFIKSAVSAADPT